MISVSTKKDDTVRARKKSVKLHGSNKQDTTQGTDDNIDEIKKRLIVDKYIGLKHKIASLSITIMSFFTTFYMIWFPALVVFDEVHFGKFASYYIERTFFFDVHPPLAKLMFAAVGYLSGFNGAFKFSNIGESYAENHVPYICLRALPASLNVLSATLIYHIMKESGSSVLTCFLTATLYVLDNAFISQHRLILLDGALIFFMLTTIYAYIRFRKFRHMPFTSSWWSWMSVTGVCMALTLSIKMIGLFVVASIGIAVIMDLWELLDTKYQLTKKTLAQHFLARAVSLIIIPSVVYMFWFYIHFKILNISGPGDSYMSAKFQSTLLNNPLGLHSLDIMYNQSVRFQHRKTSAFLHSYHFNYPAMYEDGRFSSQGAQVVGTTQPDINSYWRILAGSHLAGDGRKQYIKHNDVIQLEHIGTGKLLMTHDVAAPWTPTNQEITTTNDPAKLDDTFFRVVLNDVSSGDLWSTLSKSINLVHVKTNTGLFCTNLNLPEWGNFNLEVNGNKQVLDKNNQWVATDILGINATDVNLKKRKGKTTMNFFAKFFEYQKAMIEQNNNLIDTHPYQSYPLSWPLMKRGVNYWTDLVNKNQIYMTGNVAGWWGGLACIFIFCTIVVFDMGLRKRGTRLFRENGVNSPISYQPDHKKFLTDKTRITLKSYIGAAVIIGMQFTVYVFLAPMTYGTPSMSPEEATRHKVLKTWDLQFGTV
ncbi:hypothetical protein MFLAVUS_009941 [Mucor flavus]|uniref:Dolichyl-phosphate-mannose--protein mannosyltransferase n=1 Tax=Mucor flavus TaxID=439312 RepID=A0ABP9ZBA4_9FUNG